jgi:hypothetical protein
MTREEKKLIAIIEAAKAGTEKASEKIEKDNPDSNTIYFLNGQIAGYEAILRLLKNSDISELVFWISTRQKILIEDIINNKIKV